MLTSLLRSLSFASCGSFLVIFRSNCSSLRLQVPFPMMDRHSKARSLPMTAAPALDRSLLRPAIRMPPLARAAPCGTNTVDRTSGAMCPKIVQRPKLRWVGGYRGCGTCSSQSRHSQVCVSLSADFFPCLPPYTFSPVASALCQGLLLCTMPAPLVQQLHFHAHLLRCANAVSGQLDGLRFPVHLSTVNWLWQNVLPKSAQLTLLFFPF